MDLETYCDRLAKLAVEVGANVQEDQIVAITFAPGMEELVYAITRRAYERARERSQRSWDARSRWVPAMPAFRVHAYEVS